MGFVIYLVETAAGTPTEFDGKFVKAYDPSYRLPDGSYDGGILEVTAQREEALEFPDIGAAFQKYREAHGLRPDGHPNRPLTAWTIEVIPVPNGAKTL